MAKVVKTNQLPVVTDLTSASVIGLDKNGVDAQFPLAQIVRNNIGSFKLTDPTPSGQLLGQSLDLIGDGTAGAKPMGTYTNLLKASSTPIVIPAPATGNGIFNAKAKWNGSYWIPEWQELALPIQDVSGKADLVKIVQPTTLSALRAMTITDNTLQFKIDFGSQIVRTYSVDASDTTTADNGATVIVTANGKRLKQYNSNIALRDVVSSLNLYDLSKNVSGRFINGSNGAFITGTTQADASVTSGYIPVQGDVDIYVSGRIASSGSGTNGLSFYDASFTLITPAPVGSNWTAGPLNGVYHTPVNAKYVVITTVFNGTGSSSAVMVSYGTSEPSSYVSYGGGKSIDTFNGLQIIVDPLDVTKAMAGITAGFTANISANASSVDALNTYGVTQQDVVNFGGLQGNYVSGDFYRTDTYLYQATETSPYLLSLGIVKNITFASGQVQSLNSDRRVFYRQKYSSVIDGKYIQCVFHVKTDNISQYTFTDIYCSTGTGQTTLSIIGTPVITLVETGVYEVRRDVLIPSSGGFKEIWIGANITASGLPAVSVSGFFCYAQATATTGQTVVNTVPKKAVTDQKKYFAPVPSSAYSRWYGKTICWMGTSIPAGYPQAYAQSYPNLAAARIGATIINVAQPSSLMRIATSTGAALGSTYDVVTFGRTQAEFAAAYPSNPAYQAMSYEVKMLANLSADLFVFDFGYNDFTVDATNFASLPANNQDRNTFIGAFIYCIFKLYQAKPKANIAIFGHYENQLRPLIATAQQLVADYFEIPIYKTWERTGWSQKIVPGSSPATTVKDTWLTDAIHPNTDVSGAAPLKLSYLAQSFLESIY